MSSAPGPACLVCGLWTWWFLPVLPWRPAEELVPQPWMHCHRPGRLSSRVELFLFSSLVQVTSVPELTLTAVKLSHDSTGAQHLHLAREDRNNLFRCVLHPEGTAWMLCLEHLPHLQQFNRESRGVSLLRSPRPGGGSLAVDLSPQRAVPHRPRGQQRRPARPGAHGPVRLSEVPLPGPLLQDAEQVAVYVHERLHG